jgi:beta-N-acetylhexosaminidase
VSQQRISVGVSVRAGAFVRPLACALVALCLAATATGARPAASPSVAQMAGQLLVVRMTGRTPSPSFLARIRGGQIGGVVLYGGNYGPSGPTVLIRRLRRAAAEAGRPRLLIAIDQEGGSVKRLPGPPTIAPSEMTSATVAQAQGRETARNLRGYGIDVDFAPVLDVGHGGFIAGRTFGGTPAEVATRAVAFARGLALGGVVATAKHFPGLGYASANTDNARAIISASAPRLNADLLPYRRAIAAGLPMVMVSTAVYPRFGIHVPAACSPTAVTQLLRERLGFRGVVVTDTLYSPAVTAYKPTPQAAVAAIAAGVDLVLPGGSTRTADAVSDATYRAILDAVKTGALRQSILGAAYARVIALKRSL